jgi:LuxR family maltose regulon positive regulatory protein
MATLLSLGTRRWRRSPYLDGLLEAFQTDSVVYPATEAPDTTDPDFVLYEPLTSREIEILQLLEARLSNKEIALALIVSVETVKKHAANIYRKLNVPGRREAVDRSHDLRLLPGAVPRRIRWV